LLIPLGEIIKDSEVLKCIKDVAEFAYQSLREKKVVIEIESADEERIEQLKRTGLIDIYDNPRAGIQLLEFRHLTIQELLAAIHIMLQANNDDKKSMLKNENLKSSSIFVSGFGGLLRSRKPPLSNFAKVLFGNVDIEVGADFIKSLIKNLSDPDLTLHHGYDTKSAFSRFIEHIYEFQELPNSIVTKLKSADFSSLSYKGSIKMYCLDYFINLLNQFNIGFCITAFDLTPEVIKYGDQTFIITLLRNNSNAIRNLYFRIDNQYFQRKSTIVEEIINFNFDSLVNVTIDINIDGCNTNKILERIFVIAVKAENITLASSSRDQHLSNKEVTEPQYTCCYQLHLLFKVRYTTF